MYFDLHEYAPGQSIARNILDSRIDKSEMFRVEILLRINNFAYYDWIIADLSDQIGR